MRLVKIGDRVINLDQATFINLAADPSRPFTNPNGSAPAGSPGGAVQVHTVDGRCVTFKGEEAAVLRRYFELGSVEEPFRDLTRFVEGFEEEVEPAVHPTEGS